MSVYGTIDWQNTREISGERRVWTQAKLVLLFAFYAFVFLLTEITVNNRAGELWSQEQVVLAYGIGLISTGAGYLSYAWIQRRFLEQRQRKSFLLGAGVVFLLLLTILCLVDTTWAVVAGWGCLFAMGYVAAAIYYFTACGLWQSTCTGRMIGVSMSLAVLMQYVVMHLPFYDSTIVLLVNALGAVVIGGIVRYPLGEWCFENPLPYEENPKKLPEAGLVAAVMVLFMTVGFAFTDECVTELDALGLLDVAAWPRLFYGGGLLLAGYLVDIQRRRHIYVVTGIGFTLSILSAPLIISGYYNASMSIMYLYSGFYVIFLTTVFLDLAPQTAEPYLWAGMGRIVRSFSTALILFPAQKIMSLAGIHGIIFANVVAALAVLALVYWYYERCRSRETKKLVDRQSSAVEMAAEQAAMAARKAAEDAARVTISAAHARLEVARRTADDAMEELRAAEDVVEELEKRVGELEQQSSHISIEEFVSIYEMTPRERDVLQLLLTTDMKTKEIAVRLMISERVCQRYITSIYDKTGTGSRTSLLLKYYGLDAMN